MTRRILCVDDDPRVLSGIRRQLQHEFALETIDHPLKALELIETDGPFAVIVSDMRMPEMNGVELLQKAQELEPDSVRIMLTGNADVQTTMNAVNDGQVFRFLCKPCSAEVLAGTLHAALRQYELVTAERELVEGTLRGAVGVLSEVLSLVNPTAFGRAARVQRLVRSLAQELEVACEWELEIASMLFPLGYLTVPEEILAQAISGQELSAADQNVYEEHAAVAERLLRQIPRLEPVAAIVACQELCFDGRNAPSLLKTEQIPVGARILKVALDFDAAESSAGNPIDALQQMEQDSGRYEASTLAALRSVLMTRAEEYSMEISPCDLCDGMILAEDIVMNDDRLLVSKGHEVTTWLRERIINFDAEGRLPETVRITQPVDVPVLVTQNSLEE